MTVPDPIATPGPITAPASTVTPSSSLASFEMTARGEIPVSPVIGSGRAAAG